MIFKLQTWNLTARKSAFIWGSLCLFMTAQAQAGSIKVLGQPMDRCIQNAAEYHDVDPQLLRAILMVESRLNPKAINRNNNGTKDIGVAQINSVHLPILKVHGIQEDHLFDACINTYVGAWLLRKQIARHGLNWYGIAAYHSTTPALNYRYQVLVYNELVRSGVIQNSSLNVPPLVK
jgi:soluble lytic murein transglycosylase-like protein